MYNTPCFRAFRAGREQSASVSNRAKKDGRQISMGRRRGDTDCFKNPGDNYQANSSEVSPAVASSRDNKEGEDLGSSVNKQSSNPGTLDAQIGDQPISSRDPNSNDKKGLHAASNQQGSHPYVSGARFDDTAEEIFLTVDVPISEGHNVNFFDDGYDTLVTEVDDSSLRESVQKTEVDDNLLRESGQKTEDVEASWRLNDSHVENIQDPEAAVNPDNGDAVVSGRESLKETEEFQLAVAEEWARRQMELQKQAQEAARERKRRKVEAERKLGMEVRQRQRLEEIRQSQLKEEQTSNLKEQLRGQIHSKLKHLSAACRDMATLLRCLGISVDGGAFPTTQQEIVGVLGVAACCHTLLRLLEIVGVSGVAACCHTLLRLLVIVGVSGVAGCCYTLLRLLVNAAYKKALLRFHPDRMAVLVQRDPSHQVEAEEKFKLISRMKGILPSVATRLF